MMKIVTQTTPPSSFALALRMACTPAQHVQLKRRSLFWQVFVRESSMVPVYSILLFGGEIEVIHERSLIKVLPFCLSHTLAAADCIVHCASRQPERHRVPCTHGVHEGQQSSADSIG